MAKRLYINLLRQQRAREGLIFLSGLVAGMWFIALNAVGSDFSFFPGDLGDARFNNYLLEHAYRFFTGKEASFWSAPFMYPEKNVITYSDNLLGTAPFYAFFRMCGADRESAFQWWYLLMALLNYSCAYLFLRHLTKHAMAAVLGAIVFAFSIALQSQLGHAQTFPRFMIPLSFWAAILYHRELKVKYLFLSLFCWVYQMYCGIYLGFMLVVPLAFLFTGGVLVRWQSYCMRIKSSRWVLQVSVSLLVNAALLLILMVPYIERAHTLKPYPYEQVMTTLPTLSSYLFSTGGSCFWDALMNVGNDLPYSWDFKIFPGGIALLSLAIVFAMATRDGFLRKQKAWLPLSGAQSMTLLSLTVTLLFFLQMDGFSFYRLLHLLPGFASMRALQRIINIDILLFATALSLVSDCLFTWKFKLSKFLFPVLLLLLIVDNRIVPGSVFKVSKQGAQIRVKELVEKIKTTDSETILSYESDTLEHLQYILQIDGMLAGQEVGFPTLNGYSATAPLGFDAYWVRPNEETRRVWLKQKGFSEEHLQVYH